MISPPIFSLSIPSFSVLLHTLHSSRFFTITCNECNLVFLPFYISNPNLPTSETLTTFALFKFFRSQWPPRRSNPPPSEPPSEPPRTPPHPTAAAPPSTTAVPGASAASPAPSLLTKTTTATAAATATATTSRLREEGGSLTPLGAPDSRRSASTTSPSSSSSQRTAAAPQVLEGSIPRPLQPPRRRGEGGLFRGRAPELVMIGGAVSAAGEGWLPMRIRGGGGRFRWFATKLAILR